MQIMKTNMAASTGLSNAKLIKCVNFAAKKHSTQRRKDVDSTPYINHPIGTIVILF